MLRVDPRHPLSQRLVFASAMRQPSDMGVDVVSGRRGIPSATGVRPATTQVGKHLSFLVPASGTPHIDFGRETRDFFAGHTQVTIAVHLRLSTVGNEDAILSRRNSGSSNQFLLAARNSNKISQSWYNPAGGYGYWITSASSLTADLNTMIVTTCDLPTKVAHFYVNGDDRALDAIIEAGSGLPAVAPATPNPLILCGDTNLGWYMEGHVFGVWAWAGRILTQAEAIQLQLDPHAMFVRPGARELVYGAAGAPAGSNLAWKLAAARPALAGTGGLAG